MSTMNGLHNVNLVAGVGIRKGRTMDMQNMNETLKNSNGEVSMRAKRMKNTNITSLIGNLSLVLVLTLLMSMFGLLHATGATAAVAQQDAWVNISSTAPATISGTVNAGNVTVGGSAGTNRAFMTVVCMETAATATLSTMTASLGGVPLTMIDSDSGAQRMHCSIGYLLESNFPSFPAALSVQYGLTSSTVTGLQIHWGSYSGVDQTATTITSSGGQSVAAATVTFNATISVNANGLVVYASDWGGSTGTETLPARFTERLNTQLSAFTSAIASETTNTTVNGSYPATTSVTWAGGTGTRSSIVVVALNPSASVVAPTVASPTATSVLSTTATLGANVTSDGGASLTANGTCWALTASPATNCVDQGSHATGVFTQARTGLTEGSLIYYRGYATNSAGTGYSTDATIYTEPTQPNSLSFTGVSSTGMTANWVTGSTGNADNVIVVMRQGSAVNADPVDGITYTANAAFGSGTQIGTGNYVVYKGTGTSVPVTALAASTTYYVKVYAYAAGANGTENYNVTSPLAGSQATTGVCTLNPPTVSLAPLTGTITVDSGTAAYTLSITNNDSGAGCSNETFNLTANDSNSTNFNASTLSSASVAVAPGGTVDTSITLTAHGKAGQTAGSNTSYVAVASANHTTANTNTVTTTLSVAAGNSLLHNSIITGSSKWTGTGGWGIAGGKYGAFVCETCHTRSTTNIKRIKTTITTPDTSKGALPGDGQPIVFKTVQTGTAGAGVMGFDSTPNTPRTTSNRICEICHTYDAAQVNGVNAHPYNSAGNTLSNHQNGDGRDCVSCHKHNVGFKPPACNTCHGEPPTTNTATGGPTGLANDPFVTGSATAGAHNAHVNTYGFVCGNCHSNSVMPQLSTVPSLSNKGDISIGFSLSASATGTYGGQTNVSYNNTAGNGNKTCSTVYCHGATLSAGTDTSPVWDNPATAACGACHGASQGTPPTAGSHRRHVTSVGLLCTDCHGATVGSATHVQGSVLWSLATTSSIGTAAQYRGLSAGATGTLAPSTSYGNCTNVYCHSSVQGANGIGAGTYVSVQWGVASVACDSCHGTASQTTGQPNSGSHPKHMQSYTAFACATCHSGAGDETSKHADYSIDVVFSGMATTNGVGGSAYAGSTTPGSGYSTCSNVYCHSNGLKSGATYTTPDWGSSASGACGTCHGATALAPPASNAHAKHVGSSAAGAYKYNCSKCHSAVVSATPDSTTTPTIISTTLHVNNSFNMQFDSYNSAGVVNTPNCSNLYCHSGGTNSVSSTPNVAPNWTGTLGCTGCHSGSSATNTVMNTGSHGWHVNTHDYSCTLCHNATTSTSSAAISNPAKHVNKSVDIAFDTAAVGANGSYNGSASPMWKVPGSAKGACNNTYCHGTNSGTWGADTGNATCTKCHGIVGTSVASFSSDSRRAAPGYVTSPTLTGVNTAGVYGTLTAPAFVSNDAKVGAHNAHLTSVRNIALPMACDNCHNVPASIGDAAAPNHMNGSTSLDWGGIAATGSRTITYSGGQCSNTYCHNASKSDNTFTNPTWTNTTLITGVASNDCTRCHGWPPLTATHGSLANPGAVNNVCNACHKHVNATNNGFLSAYTPTTGGIELHINGKVEGGDCVGCHKNPQPATPVRAAAADQLINGNSHHVQGVGTVDGTQCYACHWEALSDGSPNSTYHDTSITQRGVQLVVWGSSTTRPTSDVYGTSRITYTAANGRADYPNINTHCLGCHNDTNVNTQPFSGDTHSTGWYAWDKRSIESRYSSAATVTWGKYLNAPYVAKKNIKKAYSAHGNAANNERGWDTTNGQDDIISNTSGAVNVLCFDCHNSHGSSVTGIATNYTSSTAVGGLLKDVTNGLGGFAATYKAAIGGAPTTSNSYQPGASLCFDCHLNSAATSTLPWGYTSTFNASQAIIGYMDTPYFGQGYTGKQQRYTYKQGKGGNKGGHFGASAPLISTATYTIKGLCTPCHDPHGVTANTAIISAANTSYAVPLLKGTWVTSPYLEDAAPATTTIKRGGGSGTVGTSQSSWPGYHIDQNTFNTTVGYVGTGSTRQPNEPPAYSYTPLFPAVSSAITQTPGQFAGLCLTCHPQTQIQAGGTAGGWKTRDRVHNTVKGWGGSGTNAGNAVHGYTCSKCHAPHNSGQNRLMVTNCLDFKHRGRIASGGKPTSAGYTGSSGTGNGRFPGGGGGFAGSNRGHVWPTGKGGAYFMGNAGTVSTARPALRMCHDNAAGAGSFGTWYTVEMWNSKTPW